MGRIEGIMLRKTFPFLGGRGIQAHIAACVMAKAIFVAYGTLRQEEKGRVTASDHDEYWFCRVNGARAGMKDYEWGEERTVRKMVFRPGVHRGDICK